MTPDISNAVGFDVSRETREQLDHYVALLIAENDQQNLVSRSTLDELWTRHIVDSAQLVRFAAPTASWVDIGAGPGLPGLVIALLTLGPVTLVEPRRLRADFLSRCVAALNLEDRVTVCPVKAQRITGQFDVITARAVAPIPELLAMTLPLSHTGTRWVLPKGRSGLKELADARSSWQGRFWTEPSITDGQAVIVLAEGVRPRGGK